MLFLLAETVDFISELSFYNLSSNLAHSSLDSGCFRSSSRWQNKLLTQVWAIKVFHISFSEVSFGMLELGHICFLPKFLTISATINAVTVCCCCTFVSIQQLEYKRAFPLFDLVGSNSIHLSVHVVECINVLKEVTSRSLLNRATEAHAFLMEWTCLHTDWWYCNLK